MIKTVTAAVLAAAFFAPAVFGEADDEPSAWQRETFGALADLPGKTYRGEPDEGSDEPRVDIQAWEWAIGGAAISVTHALEDGSYGGETLIYADTAAEALAYVYVTNAGFRTEGTFDVADDGAWTASEDVLGHETITKVRSMGRIEPDGTMSVRSELLENGDWRPAHAFVYRETDARPVIKPPSGP